MTDKKRMPVVYIAVSRKGLVAAFSTDEQYARAILRMKRNEDLPIVPYEPAIARCATCEYFLNPSLLGHRACNHAGGLGDVPQDGSGYCHLHPHNQETGR